MVYHLFYKILSLVLYATGDSVNFLAKPFGDVLFWIFVAHFFCFVNMALYMPIFTTAAPPPIFIIWRDAWLNFVIFPILQILLIGSKTPL